LTKWTAENKKFKRKLVIDDNDKLYDKECGLSHIISHGGVYQKKNDQKRQLHVGNFSNTSRLRLLIVTVGQI